MPRPPAARLAGEREFAFKHVLIRDVAYGMLPKAVRCRKHFEIGSFIEERAGDRADEVVALLAEHYGRAATLGDGGRPRADDELEPIHAQGAALPRGRGRRRRVALLEPPRRSITTRPRAGSAARTTRRAVARIGEKQGDVALRMGRVDEAIERLERVPRVPPRAGGPRAGRPTCTARSAPALWHKGERKPAIEHYQKGINLLKDGPPCLELVRLYEEAASLYMHTGDNMLAIYASEKALRLAERLGETRGREPRARDLRPRVRPHRRHGEGAREPRALGRARARLRPRRDDPRAARRSGYHLEVSEADYGAREQAYAEALALARADRRPARRRSSSTPRSRRSPPTAATGTRSSAPTEASAELAEREGLVGKLCFPYALRGCCLARGRLDEAERWCRRAHELAEQVGWSEVAFAALFWLARALRDRGRPRRRRDRRSTARSTSASAPGLIAQSIEATVGARDHADAGRQARAGAARPPRRPPPGRAPALPRRPGRGARGARRRPPATPAECRRLMQEARELWEALGRPLDVAICDLLLGHPLAHAEEADADSLLDKAATEFERLGVDHLARWARALVDRVGPPSPGTGRGARDRRGA